MPEASGRKRALSSEVAIFGARLKNLRQAAGLTQAQLAERAGVASSLIGHIENGKREVGIGKVWPLARALGVTPADLFGEGWS